ncbi:MAG: O-antigen ligase family protein, partial [Candidatus Zixiibacteriota bacterium]
MTNTTALTVKNTRTAPLILILLTLAPAAAAFFTGKTILVLVCLCLPLAFFLLATPRLSFYLFLLSISLYLPYHLTGFAIHPFDIAFGLLYLSIIIDFFINTRTEIRKTGLDAAFVFLIIATFISAAFAYNFNHSLVPSIRIIIIYLAFRAVFKMSLELTVRKVILFYIYNVFMLSLINCVIFVMIGGKARVFGPSWLAFEIYSITGLPMALCFFIWARDKAERLKFGFISLTIIAALLALQSRGSLVATAITIPILLMLAYYKTKKEKTHKSSHNLKRIVLIAAAAAIVVLFFNETLLVGFFDRVREMLESLTRPKGTIALRLVLWEAAIKGFFTSPLVGIGIGNYVYIDQLVPEIKTAPVWYYIRGMSAHNVILQYLCETGVSGTLALLVVTWLNLKYAWRNFKLKMTPENTQISAALFIVIIVFCHSILYMRAWTWGQEGYLMTIIFGLNAA